MYFLFIIIFIILSPRSQFYLSRSSPLSPFSFFHFPFPLFFAYFSYLLSSFPPSLYPSLSLSLSLFLFFPTPFSLSFSRLLFPLFHLPLLIFPLLFPLPRPLSSPFLLSRISSVCPKGSRGSSLFPPGPQVASARPCISLRLDLPNSLA